MKHAVQMNSRERRTLTRVICAFPVVVKSSAKRQDEATLCDVGRGGIRLHVARALMPGQFAIVRYDAARSGKPLELKVRVVWCRYSVSRAAVEAGTRILKDVPEVDQQVSDLLYDALDQAGSTQPLFDENWSMPMGWTA